MKLIAVIGSIIIATTSAFGSTPGKHIHCAVSAKIADLSNNVAELRRLFDFYLDDANGKIVSDSKDITTKTISYSDSKVEFQIEDAPFPLHTFFTKAMKGDAYFSIDRVNGRLSGVVPYFDGAEFDDGPCSVVNGPVAKF